MDLVVFQLGLGDTEQVADTALHVLLVINFEIMTFVSGNFSVKSEKQRLEQAAASFKVEIHHRHPVQHWDETVLGDPMEVHYFNSLPLP